MELADRGHDLDRMKTLSDAVFAIAMMLLVFNLKVPELIETDQPRDLGAKFLAQVPALIGFFIAFMILGLTWIVHTRIVRHLRSYDHALLVHNLCVLLFVALVPYGAALYGEYAMGVTRDDPAAAQLAWTIYASIAAIMSISMVSFWRMALKAGHVDTAVTGRLAGFIAARIWVQVLLFVASIAVAHYTIVFYAALVPAFAPLLLAWIHYHFSKMGAETGGSEGTDANR